MCKECDYQDYLDGYTAVNPYRKGYPVDLWKRAGVELFHVAIMLAIATATAYVLIKIVGAR